MRCAGETTTPPPPNAPTPARIRHGKRDSTGSDQVNRCFMNATLTTSTRIGAVLQQIAVATLVRDRLESSEMTMQAPQRQRTRGGTSPIPCAGLAAKDGERDGEITNAESALHSEHRRLHQDAERGIGQDAVARMQE